MLRGLECLVYSFRSQPVCFWFPWVLEVSESFLIWQNNQGLERFINFFNKRKRWVLEFDGNGSEKFLKSLHQPLNILTSILEQCDC